MRENLIVTGRGQITLPVKMRKRFGIKSGSVLSIEEKDGVLILRPTAVVELEIYSDEQISQWGAADRMDEEEREAILSRFASG